MKEIDEYLDRLSRSHKYRPKFRATVSGTLQPFVDLQNFLAAYPSYFDLDPTYGVSGFEPGFDEGFGTPPIIGGAVGAQLDVDGEHINLSRRITVPLRDPWFRWGDATRGWGMGLWKEPLDPGTHVEFLDDETYRRLLRARIAANHWDGTASQAKEILRAFFFDTTYEIIVEDRQIMSVIYAISGRIPSALELEIFDGEYLPLTAAGVATYHLVTTVDESPIFGWGIGNDVIGGWGSGTWGAKPRVIIEQQLAA